MIKKSLLVASVLAATSSVAFAADNTSTYCKSGFYAGLQGGRGDTFYKPSDVLNQAASQGSGTTVSTQNNYYNNVLSYSDTTTTWGTTVLRNQNVDDIGIAGRVYAGYQFNPYFAMELGYNQFSKTSFSATGVNQQYSQIAHTSEGQTSTGDISSSTSTTNYQGELTEHAIDLVAKATLPLQYGFGVYVKAGVAYIEANRYLNANTATGVSTASGDSQRKGLGDQRTNYTYTNVGINNQGVIYDKTYQAVRPTYGAGIDYTIPNTSADVEVFYSEIAGAGAIQTASLWGMGVSYKFA